MGTSLHDRVARWLGVLAACALTALAPLAAGCGGGSRTSAGASATTHTTRTQPVDPAVQARAMAIGAQLFAKNCHACHTLLGKPHTGPIIEVPAPNLDDVKLQQAYVEGRIHGGGFDMASFDGVLKPAQIRALATYVTTVAGRNVKDAAEGAPEAQQLAIGKTVFDGHCQRCHQLAGRAATGTPTYPGTSFDSVRPSEAYVIRQALRGIPEEMPSFRGKLSSAELHALARYISSVAGRGG